MIADTKARSEVKSVPSFEDLYELYRHKIIHFFVAKGLERDIAEDLSQEVFFRFLRSNKAFDNEDHARNLLYRIAQNLLIDYFRKHNGSVRIRALSPDDLQEGQIPYLAAEETSPEENLICDETSCDIRSAVAQLPPRYAQAIILKEYEGLSYREIATYMGVSQKAVESLLHRARSQLKDDLAEKGRKRGGWWSGILVGLRGSKRSAALKPLRAICRVGSKCQGLSLGLGTAGAAKGLLNLLVVMVLLGSVIGTGVAVAVSTRSDARDAAYVAEGSMLSGAEARDGEAKVSDEISEPETARENVVVEDGEDDVAVAEAGDAPPCSMLVDGGGLLTGSADAARGVITSAGDALDEILADLGRLLRSLSDPLVGLLFYAGMPPRVLEALNSVSDMKVARDISSTLVDSAVDATYVLDETAAVLSELPLAEPGTSPLAPLLSGGEGEEAAVPPDQPAQDEDTGSAAPPAPDADSQDTEDGSPSTDGGQVVEGVVGGVGDLLDDVTGVVGNLLPF